MEDKSGRPQERPLESWKEIAAHLKRDVRTVIRWEKGEGLPVHRQMHQARGSVFAYPSELEAWKASRELRLDKAPRPTAWRRATEAAGLAVAVLLALGTAGGGPFVAPLRAASDEGPGMVMRQIAFPGLERTPFAQLSPDGRKVLYVLPPSAERGGDLSVRNLYSGHEDTVVPGFGEGGFSLFRWSPDGGQVVYTHKRRELRVVSAEGGEPRSLWTSPDADVVVKPLDWSRDGRSILAALVDEGAQTTRLVIVPTERGEPRVVVSGGRLEVGDWARLSPDGRYVAGLRTREGRSQVRVWASDGEQETAVAEPGARVSPGFWSPDGAYLVFTSDRMKTQDLWAVPMRDGRPRGTPLRVKQDLGRNAALTGFTAGGHLTMIVTGEGTPANLLVLEVDPSSGRAQGDLAAYARYPTEHTFPSWSPDGSRLAYTSRRGQLRLPSIFVGSLDGASEEEIPANGYFANPIAWSPDGADLLFSGVRQQDWQVGIYRLSLATHEVTPVHLGGQPGRDSAGMFMNLQWLPLAGRFAFAKRITPDRFEIDIMDPDGRQVGRVAEVPSTFWSWPAPDGRSLAYREGRDLRLLELAGPTTVTLATFPKDVEVSGPAWSRDGGSVAFTDTRRLLILAVGGGAPRTLLEAPAGSALGGSAWFPGLAWSPDGRWIAYLQRETTAKAEPRSEIWVVPAAGGTPRRVAVAPASHPLLSDIDWHPGGAKIFATGGTGGGQVQASYQHWVIEGFLPVP